MEIKCPHCGTEYDAEESEYGRFVKCEICSKSFVIRTSSLNRGQTPSTLYKRSAITERERVRPTPVPSIPVIGRRQIKIYGYREWFLGRTPVRVFIGSSETPICEVPPDGVVTVTVNGNDVLVFRWSDRMELFRRECQLVVGNCENVVLSFNNRKDWILRATATNNVDNILKSVARSNAHVKMFVLPAGIAFFVVAIIIILVFAWKSNYISMPFRFGEETHYVYLDKYIDQRTPVEKGLIEAYERSSGLTFQNYFIACPHCGGKCNKPTGRSFPKQNAHTKGTIKYTYMCPWCHLKISDNP